jgi:hypothetical protein
VPIKSLSIVLFSLFYLNNSLLGIFLLAIDILLILFDSSLAVFEIAFCRYNCPSSYDLPRTLDDDLDLDDFRDNI